MRADYVKPSTLELIVNQLEPENANALRVSAETGIRIGDVLRLKRSDLRGNVLTFTAQKTGKSGRAQISARLRRDLNAYAGTEYLFPGSRGNATRTRQAVWADVKRVCHALGIRSNISPHSARKTFAVEDYHENGLDHVKKALQHDDTSVTLLYALSDVLGEREKKTNICSGKEENYPNNCSGFESRVLSRLDEIECKLDFIIDKLRER